jgi:ribosomal protein L39E
MKYFATKRKVKKEKKKRHWEKEDLFDEPMVHAHMKNGRQNEPLSMFGSVRYNHIMFKNCQYGDINIVLISKHSY